MERTLTEVEARFRAIENLMDVLAPQQDGGQAG